MAGSSPTTVLFAGLDSSGELELWQTNGSAAGTHELTGIGGASQIGLTPSDLIVFNGEILFSGVDTSFEDNLWITNGTVSGTIELGPISGAQTSGMNGGAGGLQPTDLTVFNSEVLFEGKDLSGHYGLWVTNGTATGTHELTGITGASPDGIALPDALLYTPDGLPTLDLSVFNGEVLFDGADAQGLQGLWVTNGTAAGTHELTGINGAATSGSGLEPFDFTVFNNIVLFEGFDSEGIYGLWVTNGTAAGTHELTGISGVSPNGISPSGDPSEISFIPLDLTVFGSQVLFEGADASGHNGLWVTNGTAAGTHELTGISGASSQGRAPTGFAVLGGEVLFNGTDSQGQEGLWVTNGTAAGTHELTGIAGAATVGTPDIEIEGTAAPVGFDPFNLTVVNNEVFFDGFDAEGQEGLWVTNGTAASTVELTGISDAAANISSALGGPAESADLTVFDAEVFFAGYDTSNTIGLFLTNGTAAGTHELSGISGALASGPGLDPTSFAVLGSALIFEGTDAGGLKGLWASTGTAAGTHELTGISGVASIGLDPTDLTVFSSKVFFNGVDSSGQNGLWVTNGTAAGTHELTGVANGATSGLNPTDLTVFGSKLLFAGTDANSEIGLWVSNGTVAGTSELTGISGANFDQAFPEGIDPTDPTVFNTEVLFNGVDDSGLNGLWATNGTVAGTTELTGIVGANTGSNDSFGFNPTDLTVFNGKVLFNGTDTRGPNGEEFGLWLTNGTAAGTSELTGIAGANTLAGLMPKNMTGLGSEVLFNGLDANGHFGLWVTNGTAAGTSELSGINGASASGLNPTDLTVVNGAIEFLGYDATGHFGLWVTNGTAAGTHELSGTYSIPTNELTALFITPFASPNVPDDFFGNGTSDVLLQSGGNLIDWLMQNGSYSSYVSIGGASGYGVIATGDFNGDGITDLLLQNGGGSIIDWALKNGAYSGYVAVGNANASGYGVVGTGDVNGDGVSDVLLENGSGGLIDWIMKNGAYSGYNAIGNTSGYGVLRTGDFNGDGTVDVLLQNGAGSIIDWMMSNGSYAGYNNIGNANASGYGVVGAGDFNGDGTTDLLLENGSGNLIDWIMKSGVYSGYNEIGGSAGYSVVGTGDYNGDGTADILLQNASGNVIDWILKNGAYSGWNEVGSAGTYSVVNK